MWLDYFSSKTSTVLKTNFENDFDVLSFTKFWMVDDCDYNKKEAILEMS